jgi:hypothetical protein
MHTKRYTPKSKKPIVTQVQTQAQAQTSINSQRPEMQNNSGLFFLRPEIQNNFGPEYEYKNDPMEGIVQLGKCPAASPHFQK